MGKTEGQQITRDSLFDILLIVELQEEHGGKTAPFISYRFPKFENFESNPFSSSVTQFCFPDINQFPTENMPSECFSFVLTEGDGERRFGYCLRKLLPGSGPRFPIAFSIMSFFPCYTLYKKILEEVAYHYENTSLRMLSDFLASIMSQPFPGPGKSFSVNILNDNKNKNQSDLQFTRPDDSDTQLDYVDIDSLLQVLNERNIVSIFSSMIIERRIIFCSSKLSTLSSCIQTAVALLYPFTWQHIYIPVLPKSLLSFCCAPMPFVVGILASELNEVMSLPMDEVLIINLDNDSFIRTPDPSRDDIDLLPSSSITLLTKSIRDTWKMIKRCQKKMKSDKLSKSESEIMNEKLLAYELKKQKRELKDAFLHFFVSILGSYRGFIQNNHFNRDQLLEVQPPETRHFMELLVGSQMFEQFIDERVGSEINNGGFERAVSRFEKEAEIASNFGEDVRNKQTKKSVFNSIRSLINSNKDDHTPSITLSTPTLVQATNERAGKLSRSSEAMVTPNKIMPRPPRLNSNKPLPPIPDVKTQRSSSLVPPVVNPEIATKAKGRSRGTIAPASSISTQVVDMVQALTVSEEATKHFRNLRCSVEDECEETEGEEIGNRNLSDPNDFIQKENEVVENDNTLPGKLCQRDSGEAVQDQRVFEAPNKLNNRNTLVPDSSRAPVPILKKSGSYRGPSSVKNNNRPLPSVPQ